MQPEPINDNIVQHDDIEVSAEREIELTVGTNILARRIHRESSNLRPPDLKQGSQNVSGSVMSNVQLEQTSDGQPTR